MKVWPKSQKCRFLGKIRPGYGLFSYQLIGSGQGYSGPIRGRYSRACAGKCRFREEIAGIAVYEFYKKLNIVNITVNSDFTGHSLF